MNSKTQVILQIKSFSVKLSQFLGVYARKKKSTPNKDIICCMILG